MTAENFRYVITHDPGLIERFGVVVDRLFRAADAQPVPPMGLDERAARVGFTFPLLALDGDEVVGGIIPQVRHAGNTHILFPEEEGTPSRVLGSHPLLSRCFVWSNHVCVDSRYKGSGIFRELCYHLSALAKVFRGDAIALTCRGPTAELYKVICEKYAGLRGDAIDIDFQLPPAYQQSDRVFFLMPTEGAPVPDVTLQRVLDHCKRYGIEVPG